MESFLIEIFNSIINGLIFMGSLIFFWRLFGWRQFRKMDKVNIQTYEPERTLAKQLESEANYFAQIIIRTWEQMGFYHERRVLKYFKWRDRVKFERIVVTPQDIQLKVAVTRMRNDVLFSQIPHGVIIKDLISEPVMEQLCLACERYVSAQLSQNNGLWLAIERVTSLTEEHSGSTLTAH